MTQMPEENKNDQQKPATLAEALTQIVVGIGTAVRTVVEAAIPVMQAVYDAQWERYRAAGMPYGNDHQGLMRWLEDMNEIMRLNTEIEVIKRRHLLLRDTYLIAERTQEKQAEGEAQDDNPEPA